MRTTKPPEESFLRSISCPALVKKRRHATKSLLKATEACDTKAIRALALHSGAEMEGGRAVNRQGLGPFQIMAGAVHLTHDQSSALRQQLTDLPMLVSAARGAERHIKFESEASPNAASLARSASVPPKGSQKKGSRAQAYGAQAGIISMARTMDGGHGRACQAAFTNPQLLQAPPDKVQQCLPALATALKSEEVAIQTLTKNPALLKYSPEQITKIVPVLCNLFGDNREAAHAVSIKPELLAVAQAKQIKGTMQTIADCLSSMSEAQVVVMQNMAPPSLQVTARAWTHEAVVGGYRRLKGIQVDERPVYKKPAASMRKFAERAQDMYLMYNEAGAGGGGCWEFTTSYERAKPRKMLRTPSKSSRVSASTKYSAAAPSSCYGYSLSHCMTPDQAESWMFWSDKDQIWEPDAFTHVSDGGVAREISLLTVPPEQVRRSFNVVKELLGPFWIMANADGSPLGDARCMSCMRRGDRVHRDGQGRIESLGNFRIEEGWSYIQASSSSASPLKLVAWEPISVVLMYIDHPPEEEAPAANGDDAPSPACRYPHREPLLKESWRMLEASDREGMRLPKLGGVPPVGDVFLCEFGLGRVSIPLVVGPTGPPLIFVKTHISAHTSSRTPCQLVKPQENAVLVRAPPPDGEAEAAEAEVALPPGDDGGDVDQLPKLASGGHLGYLGFSFFRLPARELAQGCSPTRPMLTLEAVDRSRLVVAWFRMRGGAGDASAPMPPPPPWVRGEGWAPAEMKLIPVVVNELGEKVGAEYLFTKDTEPGVTTVLGSGTGPDALTPVVFWRRLGDSRPNVVRTLIHEEPSILASGAGIDLLRRNLRAELGDEWAHRLIMDRQAEWLEFVQECDETTIKSWVYKCKIECFSREVGGSLTMAECRKLADMRLPHLEANNRAFREAFPFDGMAETILKKDPSLLRCEPKILKSTMAALTKVFEKKQACEFLVARPGLVRLGDELELFWAKLQEHHPGVWQDRIVKNTNGEWPCWGNFVGKSSEAVAAWLGRVTAEEEHLACCRRVQSFGIPRKNAPE